MKHNSLLVMAGLFCLVAGACKTQQQTAGPEKPTATVMVANEAEVPMVVKDLDDPAAIKSATNDYFVSDANFAARAIEMGMATIKFGLLAERKATKGTIKSLGVELQEELLRVNGLLMEIARENNWPIPDALNDRHQEELDGLAKLPVDQFDRQAIDQLIFDLEDKQAMFKAASGKLTNSRLRNYIIQTSPALSEYLERAREIQKKLAAGK